MHGSEFLVKGIVTVNSSYEEIECYLRLLRTVQMSVQMSARMPCSFTMSMSAGVCDISTAGDGAYISVTAHKYRQDVAAALLRIIQY
jgi:hypothetical protein